jgi:hypothetical protein
VFQAEAAKPAGVRPVKTMVIGKSSTTYVRFFPGKVEAAKSADLVFQVSGSVVKPPVKEANKIPLRASQKHP